MLVIVGQAGDGLLGQGVPEELRQAREKLVGRVLWRRTTSGRRPASADLLLLFMALLLLDLVGCCRFICGGGGCGGCGLSGSR